MEADEHAVDAARRLLDVSHCFLFAGLTKARPTEPGPSNVNLGIGIGIKPEIDDPTDILETLIGQFLFDSTGGNRALLSGLVEFVDEGIEVLQQQDVEMVTDVHDSFGTGEMADTDALGRDEQLGHLNKKRETAQQWFEQNREPSGFRVGVVGPETATTRVTTDLEVSLADPPWNTSGSDSPDVGSPPPVRVGHGWNATPAIHSVDWISPNPSYREPVEVEAILLGGWVLTAANVLDRDPSELLLTVANHTETE